jgi:hypothetical protein
MRNTAITRMVSPVYLLQISMSLARSARARARLCKQDVAVRCDDIAAPDDGLTGRYSPFGGGYAINTVLDPLLSVLFAEKEVGFDHRVEQLQGRSDQLFVELAGHSHSGE